MNAPATEQVKTVKNVSELTIGDQLFRRKGMVMHVGIYIGNQLILHNTPSTAIDLDTPVDFDTFANGKTVYARPSKMLPYQVVAKAQALLATPAKYRLFSRNCEHTANAIVKGLPQSAQLEEIEAWALIGGAFGKSFGHKAMYIGGAIGAIGGLLSLPRMLWIK